MSQYIDTGKWVIENLFHLSKNRKLEEEQKCGRCGKMGMMKSMIKLGFDDVPNIGVGYYHSRCAEVVWERYNRVCGICDNSFFDATISDLCPKCRTHKLYRKESERIANERWKAEQRGCIATLTIKEWLETLDYFDWRCAYCGGQYRLLEHFNPITRGGGTTRTNCVPACYHCNGMKDDKNPFESHLKKVPVVYRYLQSRA